MYRTKIVRVEGHEEKQEISHMVDHKYGIESVKDGPDRLGFVCNFKTGLVCDEDGIDRTVLHVYFLEENGS